MRLDEERVMAVSLYKVWEKGDCFRRGRTIEKTDTEADGIFISYVKKIPVGRNFPPSRLSLCSPPQSLLQW